MLAISVPALARLIAMHKETAVLRCTCGERLLASVCYFIEASTQPELEEELLWGRLNASLCPKCGEASLLDEPFIYSDSKRGMTIRVLPRSWKGSELDVSSPLLPREERWTRTFYGLDALVSFIAAEGNVPEKYRDLVADQSQTISDMYYAIRESRCRCGGRFKIEGSLLVHSSRRGPLDVVRARCADCGEIRHFLFPIQRVAENRQRQTAQVPIYVSA